MAEDQRKRLAFLEAECARLQIENVRLAEENQLMAKANHTLSQWNDRLAHTIEQTRARSEELEALHKDARNQVELLQQKLAWQVRAPQEG